MHGLQRQFARVEPGHAPGLTRHTCPPRVGVRRSLNGKEQRVPVSGGGGLDGRVQVEPRLTEVADYWLVWRDKPMPSLLPAFARNAFGEGLAWVDAADGQRSHLPGGYAGSTINTLPSGLRATQ